MALTYPRSEEPPGKTEPYLLGVACGEIWAFPGGLDAERLMVTGRETANSFTVMNITGTKNVPIGFHYHNESHDVFLVVKGQVNVWVGDQCRTMNPGDFASIPPKVVHQFQIISEHSEMLALIIPGGWEEYFRIIGERYYGPLFPVEDDRDPVKVLLPRILKASETIDVVPMWDMPYFPPQPWDDERDNRVPNGLEGYFLRNQLGPKWINEGTLIRPLVEKKQSGGRFSIATIEGSSTHIGFFLASALRKFKLTHHAIYVVEGTISVVTQDNKILVTPGEAFFIPAGTAFTIKFASRFARIHMFADGDGFQALLWKTGQSYPFTGIPETADLAKVDAALVKELESELSFETISHSNSA